MIPMTKRLLGVVFLLSLFGELAFCEERLSVAQKKEVRAHLKVVSDRKADLAEKEKAAQAILSGFGTEGTKMLAKEVAKHAKKANSTYIKAFRSATKAQYKAKKKISKPAEVETLRAQVLALKAKGNLSKDMIAKDGYPGIMKLYDLLFIKRGQVLAADESLAPLRDELKMWTQLLNQCNGVLKPEEPQVSAEAILVNEEKMWAFALMPMDPKNLKVVMANAKLHPKLDLQESDVIRHCNEFRALLGLRVTLIDLKLCDASRDHSKDMVEKKFFAHESPLPGKKTPWDRAKNFKTSASSENIHFGSKNGWDANKAWFFSPGHHKNMLGNHVRIGVGRHQVYFTEMFGG